MLQWFANLQIYHLCNIARIKHHLTPSATEQIVHALVISRLDVSNVLRYRLPFRQIRQLQRVQNWAAHLALLVHRAFNGHAPDYVANCVTRRLPPRSLSSSELNLLRVSQAKWNWGDRFFGIAAPTLWNMLPQHLTLTGLSDDVFKTQLNKKI